jgi:branched-subunit amino acid aminotransferase/4-amino-4-deoxychorismate lyase
LHNVKTSKGSFGISSAGGYEEAITLSSDGQHVSEGSAMNIFMVKNKKLITPPTYNDILEGITRNTVIELAKNELNLEVSERQIDRTELYIADELFFCGTGAQVSPIGSVDGRKIGSGEMGNLTKIAINFAKEIESLQAEIDFSNVSSNEEEIEYKKERKEELLQNLIKIKENTIREL